MYDILLYSNIYNFGFLNRIHENKSKSDHKWIWIQITILE
jgi:hypothetical protein